MARERYIHGKKDNAKHDGPYSNTKRLQQAQAELSAFLDGQYDDIEPKIPVVKPVTNVIKLTTK